MNFYDENVCRLCLEPDGYLSIFSIDDSLDDKIMFCSRIKVKILNEFCPL